MANVVVMKRHRALLLIALVTLLLVCVSIYDQVIGSLFWHVLPWTVAGFAFCGLLWWATRKKSRHDNRTPTQTPLPLVSNPDPAHQSILEAARREAHEALYAAGVPVQIGYEEIFDSMMQKILQEKYGLDWEPAQVPYKPARNRHKQKPSRR